MGQGDGPPSLSPASSLSRGGGLGTALSLTPTPLSSLRPPVAPAVQEERQRGKEKEGEGDVAGGGANEDMPVEKILEAELAVEQKSDQGVDGSGTGGSSVSGGCGAAGSERSPRTFDASEVNTERGGGKP